MPVDFRPLPVLAQDPEGIPSLLYGDTFHIRCLPFLRIRQLNPKQAPESPSPYDSWDMELETHWRKIHPKVWEILEEEDEKDWDEMYRLGDEWERAVQCGEITVEEEKEVRDLQAKLEDRLVIRSNRLLALNETRNAVRAMEAARKPGLTLEEFLQALPIGDLGRFATHPAASLWPLSSVAPPCKGLTLVLHNTCRHYMIPSHPSAAYDAYLAKTRSLIPTAAPASSSSSTGKQNQLLPRRRNAGKRE